jgi:putative membrane protein
MAENFQLPESSKILEQISAKKALGIILGLSVVAVLFLFWLIYFNEGSETAPTWVKNLSAVNAGLNSLSTIFLLLAFREIKRKDFQKHMRFNLAAFVTSSLFLVSYVVYHHFVGDTKFMGEGFIRPVYFFILITHIVLSIFVVPLVLASFYFSLSGKFNTHKKVSRWTFPIWLYVSVTGVLVFFMLKIWG